MGGTPATSINNYKKFDGKHGIVVSQNPVFGDQAEFMIKTPEAAQINIRILDNLGNTVLETNGRNDETFVWDLRNNAGRFVANGVYLILVEATGINQRRFTYSAQMGVKR
jgi:flagellar hook assembly protein FlgD